MKLMFRIQVLGRYMTLNRQAREIKRVIQSLPVTSQRSVGQLVMTEIEAAAQTMEPHLYGSTTTPAHRAWGNGASQAYSRSQSRVQQLRLRGVALWLAIVYHETRASKFPGFDGLRREVLGMLGTLKGTHGGNFNPLDAFNMV